MMFRKEIITILSIFTVFFSLVVFYYSNKIHDDVYAMIYVSPIIILVILSFSLSRRYKKCGFFSYGHLVLGLALSALLLAEIAWRLMDYWNLPQYDSYPDIFYYVYNLLLLAHPYIIMKYFKVKPSRIAWLLFILCIVVGNGIYILLSNGHVLVDFGNQSHITERFTFGLIFVTLTNAIIGSTIMATLSLKRTKIFRVWILIGVSLTINSIGDIYYYASENFSDWQPSDPVNIIWFVGYIILLYALIEHIPIYARKNKKLL